MNVVDRAGHWLAPHVGQGIRRAAHADCELWWTLHAAWYWDFTLARTLHLRLRYE
jgi:hypothetical protein